MYRYNSGAIAMVLGWIVTLAVVIAIKIFLASNASDIAQDKGYEKRKWFHMCFWLSLPAYLIVCAMPDKTSREITAQLVRKLEKQQLTASQTTKSSTGIDNTKKTGSSGISVGRKCRFR